MVGNVVPLFEPDLRLPFHRSAAAYLLNGRVFVCPYARTRPGVSVMMEIVHEASSEDQFAVGQAVLDALSDCIDNVSNDFVFAKKQAIFRATKLRSWSQLNKKAASASIVQRPSSPGVVEITPMRRSGGQGSTHISDKMELANLQAKSLGETVRCAFAASELDAD